MKQYRVFGSAEVTVSCVVSVREETIEKIKSEDDLRKLLVRKAKKKFGGIHEYIGNGGYDKLIGVNNEWECIAADSEVEFDDFLEEW